MLLDANLLTNKDTWQTVASIATTVSVVFLVVGPRVKKVRDFIGFGLQEMLGVTALRQDQRDMHESNQARFGSLEDGQAVLSSTLRQLTVEVEEHHSDAEIHLKRGHA